MQKTFPTAAVIAVITLLVLLGYGGFRIFDSVTPGQYDNFAKCLGKKGAKFYCAYWCAHCKKQKERFGKSAKLIPYVECARPGAPEQEPVCKEKNVTGYPTWIFEDGSRIEREMELQELSEKTGCQYKK